MMIRQLLSADAQALKALRIDAAATSPRSIYPTPSEIALQTLESFHDEITAATTIAALGAFVDVALVGFVGVRRDVRMQVRHKAQIWGVYVKPAYRQRGIARALMCAAVEAARACADVRVVLLSVDQASVGATRLYQSLGFCVYGVEENSMLVEGVWVHEERMRLVVGCDPSDCKIVSVPNASR